MMLLSAMLLFCLLTFLIRCSGPLVGASNIHNVNRLVARGICHTKPEHNVMNHSCTEYIQSEGLLLADFHLFENIDFANDG